MSDYITSPHNKITNNCLTVGLGNALNLILLLDGIGVGGSSGGVHNLIGQAFGNGLDVSE
jgi:hypothetical protein